MAVIESKKWRGWRGRGGGLEGLPSVVKKEGALLDDNDEADATKCPEQQPNGDKLTAENGLRSPRGFSDARITQYNTAMMYFVWITQASANTVLVGNINNINVDS